jgi:hypothetical protein
MGTIDGEHGIVTGQTRFGKSFLSKGIVRFFPDVIIHDPKNRYTIGREDELRFRHVDELYGLEPEESPFVIYAPAKDEVDDPRAREEFCAYVFARRPSLVVFDEIVRIGDTHDYPPSLRYLYTAGAEEGICVLGLTQEPIRVPSFVYTQSAHHYCFYIGNRSHRDKVAGFMPIDEKEIAKLQKKEFFYWRNDMRKPIGPVFL